MGFEKIIGTCGPFLLSLLMIELGGGFNIPIFDVSGLFENLNLTFVFRISNPSAEEILLIFISTFALASVSFIVNKNLDLS